MSYATRLLRCGSAQTYCSAYTLGPDLLLSFCIAEFSGKLGASNAMKYRKPLTRRDTANLCGQIRTGLPTFPKRQEGVATPLHVAHFIRLSLGRVYTDLDTVNI
jgi:hypothetical protein